VEIDFKKVAYVVLGVLLVIAVNQYVVKPIKDNVVAAQSQVDQLKNVQIYTAP